MVLFCNVLSFLCILMLFFSIGWLLANGMKNAVTFSFIGSQLCIICWCISQICSRLSTTTKQIRAFYTLGYFGICFLGSFWLLFTLFYCKKRVRKSTYLLLSISPVVHYVMFLLDSKLHLFYKNLSVHSGETQIGIFYVTNLGYTYICVFLSILCFLLYARNNPSQRKVIHTILISMLIPFSVNFLFQIKLLPIPLDMTPTAFSFSSLFIVLAAYRLNFLNVNALALDRTLLHIEEGLLIYNKNGILTYANNMVQTLLPDIDFHNMEHFLSAFSRQSSLETERKLQLKRYEHRKKHGKKKNDVLAYTFLITDVTKYEELLQRTRELAISNQALAIEKERNRIAQEVHDTTGYTLTMIQSLTKMSQISLEKSDFEACKTYIKQAEELSRTGIKELRCSINHLKKQEGFQLVTQGVYALCNQSFGITIDVCIQGEDSPVYSPFANVIYESLREAITNCVRYAKADHMDVIVKFKENLLELFIFDNGIGCENIQDGNGLTGIRERIAAVNGTLKIHSAANEGFQLTIKIPVTIEKEPFV